MNLKGLDKLREEIKSPPLIFIIIILVNYISTPVGGFQAQVINKGAAGMRLNFAKKC